MKRKLKQKFIQPAPLPDQTFKEIIKTPIFESSEELERRGKIEEQKIKQMQEFQERKKIQKFERLKEK